MSEPARAVKIRLGDVLVATGRKPYTEGLGLESIGIKLDDKGRIPVEDDFRTSAEGIYAIGDVIEGPMIAHKAEEEGIAVAEQIVKGYGHVNYDVIPAVIFTEPEIASVGKTEDELKEQNVAYRKGSFPFRANGRALSLGNTTGKVKVLAHAETDRVLGVHILGPRAGDLIAEAAHLHRHELRQRLSQVLDMHRGATIDVRRVLIRKQRDLVQLRQDDLPTGRRTPLEIVQRAGQGMRMRQDEAAWR
jgi:pyruvate/2-oxoglutarate dehydrogenase complex dihydrolipoamide dehydrogenase (E3) component